MTHISVQQTMNVNNSRLHNQQNPHPCAIWLTGLSGAGKSTTAGLLHTSLTAMQHHCCILDGDLLRKGLCKDLGFSAADRIENIRRAGEVAKLLVDAGLIVIVATISPFKKMRDDARNIFTAGSFIEVFIDAPLATCEARDVKGLYRKARSGALKQFTGIDSDYEAPQNPEVHLHTDQQTPDEGVAQIISYFKNHGYLHNNDRA